MGYSGLGSFEGLVLGVEGSKGRGFGFRGLGDQCWASG